MNKIEVLRPADSSSKRAKPDGRYGIRVQQEEVKKKQLIINRCGGLTPNKWGLTPQEVQVMNLACEGLTCGEIAERIHLSPKTVSTYFTRIHRRMECRNMLHCILVWDRETYVKPEPITPLEVLRLNLGREPTEMEKKINFEGWQRTPEMYRLAEQEARAKREQQREAKAPQA